MSFTDEVVFYQKNVLVVEIFYGKMSYQKLEEYLPYDGFDALGKTLSVNFSVSEMFGNRASIIILVNVHYCILQP